MFTGITQEIGKVKSIKKLSEGMEVVCAAVKVIPDLKIGDSIAVNGVCSTVTDIQKKIFTVQYLKETQSKTTVSDLKINDLLNLELSLTPISRIGGHFVSGHVDGLGIIEKITFKEPWGILLIKYNSEFKKYLIPKGSICIDGISLTIVNVNENTFSCHLIPHTICNTTLAKKQKDDRVNLEYDILAKYLYNFYNTTNLKKENTDDSLKESLLKAGFI